MDGAKHIFLILFSFILLLFFGVFSAKLANARVYVDSKGNVVIEKGGHVLGDEEDGETGDKVEAEKGDKSEDSKGEENADKKDDNNEGNNEDSKDEKTDENKGNDNTDEVKKESENEDEFEGEKNGQYTKIEKKIEDDGSSESKVEVENEDGKLKLKYKNDSESEGVDINDESRSQEELDIQESDDYNRTKVKADGDNFILEKKGVGATTKYPLQVNLETNELVVKTPAGEKTVSILPDQAVQNILKANVVDEVTDKATSESSGKERPELLEDEEGDLVYEIEGEKYAKVLGLFKTKLKRKVMVSAETGETKAIKETIFTKLKNIFSTED